MPVRLIAARRAAPLALLLPLLSGCGPARNEFPPPCPSASVLDPTGDLVEYRPNSSGRDLTDIVVQGRITGVAGQCRAGDKDRLDVTVSIGFAFTRGPALQGDTAHAPVFVAVTEGDRILDKRVYGVDAVFPPNVDRVTLRSGDINLSLPVSATKTGAAYTILAGFQLTPDQVAAARARRR